MMMFCHSLPLFQYIFMQVRTCAGDYPQPLRTAFKDPAPAHFTHYWIRLAI